MTLFGGLGGDVMTSYGAVEEPKTRTLSDVAAPRGQPTVSSDSGRTPALDDQFFVFQLNNQPTGPTIVESSRIEPSLEGSADHPDVLALLEMHAFHVGADEDVEPGTSATLRVDFGKDEKSTNRSLDTVFWAIATGLSLYDEVGGGRSEPRELNADFHRAFANRPIEIPGGLGRLGFEVVKHEEPPWWRKLLGFGASDTAARLVSTLGFPAVTTQAISVIDELLDRLLDASPQVLFRSMPQRFALTRKARDDFCRGNTRVRMGVLNPGFCVLARGRDFARIAEADAAYYPTYGKLVPSDVEDAALVSGRYEDPFESMTYAVFGLRMKEADIDPTFNFRS